MASTTDLYAELIFYLRIEGIGYDEGGMSKTLFVFDRIPDDWTPTASQKFVTGLQVPGSVSQSVNGLIGGIASVTGLSFELVEFTATTTGDPFWATLFATQRSELDPATYPTTQGTITLDRDDTTWNVEGTGGFPAAPATIYSGLETMRYGGKVATQFQALTRGLHPVDTSDGSGSFAQTHRVDANLGLAPLIATYPRTWYGRKVRLCAVARNADGSWQTASEAANGLYTGHITSTSFTGNIWTIGTQSIMEDLRRPIFAGPIAETTMQGIWLGTQPETRRVSVFITDWDYGGAFSRTNTFYTFTLASQHDSFADFMDAWNDASVAEAPGDLYVLLIVAEGRLMLSLANHETDHRYFLGVACFGGIAALLGNFTFTWEEDLWTDGATDGALRLGPPYEQRGCFFEQMPAEGITLAVESTETPYTFQIDQGDEAAAGETVPYGYVVLDDGREAPPLLRARVRAAQSLTCDYVPQGSYPQPTGLVMVWGMPTAEGGEIVTPPKVRQAFKPEHHHLAELIPRVLLSTGTSGYNHATYDVYPAGFGIGMAAADVDEDSIADALAPFEAGQLHRTYVFTKPRSAWEWLEEECRTLGLLVSLGTGLVFRRAPTFATAGLAVGTFDEGNKAARNEHPVIERATRTESPDGLINTAKLRGRWSPTRDEYGETITLVDTVSVDGYGQSRVLELGTQGMTGSSAGLVPSVLARLQLFRFPFPRITRSIDRTTLEGLVLGNAWLLTDSGIPDPFTGARGVTNRLTYLEQMRFDFHEARGDVTLRMFPNQRAAALAPSALLDYDRGDGGYDAVSSPRRLYTKATTYSDVGTKDVTFFAVRDKIRIIQQDAANPSAPLTWGNVEVMGVVAGSNYIEIDSALAGFVATNRYTFTFDDYDVAVSGQRTRGTWEADSADGFIQATTDWYPWT